MTGDAKVYTMISDLSRTALVYLIVLLRATTTDALRMALRGYYADGKISGDEITDAWGNDQ